MALRADPSERCILSKRYVVCGLALVVALCFTLPAVGAAPSSLADALGPPGVGYACAQVGEQGPGNR